MIVSERTIAGRGAQPAIAGGQPVRGKERFLVFGAPAEVS